ncbi:ComEC/Rec2 family competence protein [Candidatus Peregrinibacteria bacterium]|nr:ComEC/Rec2 family competence protein [Candidatus Peregrinibacteria bacterium]
MKRKVLLFVLSFLFGILNTFLFGVPIAFFIFVAMVFCCLFFLRCVKIRVFIFFVLFGFVLGIVRFNSVLPRDSPEYVHFFNQKGTVKILGIIYSEPERDSFAQRFVFKVSSIAFFLDNKRFTVPQSVEGKVSVSLPRYPEYEYGDQLHLIGILETPLFSLERFYVFSSFYHPTVFFVAHDKGSVIFAYLYKVKRFLEARIQNFLPEPHSSFAAGLLLGSRQGIPKSIMDDFQTVGLTHILALSGYNITLVIVFISSIFQFLHRRFQIIVALFAVILFTLLTGASSSCVRAAIMGVITLLGSVFGRKSDAAYALLLSAFLMTFIHPYTFLKDAGFHLSFAATLGLIFFTPQFESFFYRISLPMVLRKPLSATFAAYTSTLPIIIFTFHKISFIAPLANILVSPLIPFAMFFVALSLGLSFFFFPLAFVFGSLSWFFLEIILKMVLFLSNVPFASFSF